jgi:hypothetical protein
MRAAFGNHVNPGGFCVAATYVLTVIAAFVAAVSWRNPNNLGYEGFPLVLLSLPWYLLHPRLLVPGLIANTGFAYLLGTLLHKFWCRLIRQ